MRWNENTLRRAEALIVIIVVGYASRGLRHLKATMTNAGRERLGQSAPSSSSVETNDCQPAGSAGGSSLLHREQGTPAPATVTRVWTRRMLFTDPSRILIQRASHEISMTIGGRPRI